VGPSVGSGVGCPVGRSVGVSVGMGDGSGVGLADGIGVGTDVGVAVGLCVVHRWSPKLSKYGPEGAFKPYEMYGPDVKPGWIRLWS
jgi:hypothetical protein